MAGGSIRRFLCVVCGYLCLAASDAASANVPLQSSTVTKPAPAAPQPEGSVQNSPRQSKASEQTRTEHYTLSRDRYEKAVAYSRAGYRLYFISYFLSAIVLLLLLRLRIAAKFRDIAESLSVKWWVQGLIFVPLLLLTIDLLDLPLSIYWHSLSLRYQQSIQRWGPWFWDWTKGVIVETAFGIVLALILFAVMRWSPRRWWLVFWFPAVLILFGLILITPLMIDPLFSKFEPLGNQYPELVASIERLTERAGVEIPPQRIFLMTASNKTNAVNAYVTGLGASKRVVIWDTLIQKSTNDEVLVTVGHELGHYVLGHVFRGAVLGAAGLLLAFFLLFRGLHWALSTWGREWNIREPEDWASLTVLLLLLEVILFVSSPVTNAISRMEEHDADIYGLEITHGIIPNSNEVAAHSFQVLGELDLADPDPPAFIKFWLYSHPPLEERLVFALTYDPWSKGESPKFVK